MQRVLFFILLFIFFCLLTGNGQDDMSKLVDSNYIEAILDRSISIESLDAKRVEIRKALSFARVAEYDKGVWSALLLLFEVEVKDANLTEAIRNALEAEQLLKKRGNQPMLADLYFRLGQFYQKEEIYSVALNYYKLANELNLTLDSVDETGVLERHLGDCYLEINQPDSAAIFFNRLLKYHRERNQKPEEVYTRRRLVMAANRKQDYATALKHNLAIESLIKDGFRTDLLPVITNNIGYNYFNLGDNEKSIEYFDRTLKLLDVEDEKLGTLYNNLGVAHHNQGNQKNAIDYLQRAYVFYSNRSDTEEAARVQNVIASIFLNARDHYNALAYNELAIAEASNPYRPAVLVDAYATAGEIHEALFNYETALEFLQKHLVLRDSLLLEERLRRRQLVQQRASLERTEKEYRLDLVSKEVKDLLIEQLQKDQDLQKIELERQRLENEQAQQRILAQEKDKEIIQLERDRANQALLLARQALSARFKEEEISRLEQDSSRKALLLEKQQLEAITKDQQIKTLEREGEIRDLTLKNQDLELQRVARNRQYLIAIFIAFLVILALILRGLIYSRRTNRALGAKNQEIEQQKEEIEKSRDEAEALLLNILPRETAAELTAQGVATPKNYDLVTVLFTDFSGFTSISEKMSPQELVDELNICFRAFDEIIEHFGLEKIKTIGDGYMCAGGIPQPNGTNPRDTVAAGLEMMAFLRKRKRLMSEREMPYWDMRVGIHTGQVIAGVVGKKKFAYDIWGDTVNTASRMESHGEKGRVNISEATYQHIKENFDCTSRGEIEVKNKGRIGMYFVNGVVESS